MAEQKLQKGPGREDEWQCDTDKLGRRHIKKIIEHLKLKEIVHSEEDECISVKSHIFLNPF